MHDIRRAGWRLLHGVVNYLIGVGGIDGCVCILMISLNVGLIVYTNFPEKIITGQSPAKATR